MNQLTNLPIERILDFILLILLVLDLASNIVLATKLRKLGV